MEISRFFNSSGGDRIYNATDLAAHFSMLISNGIFSRTATNLLVAPLDGMSIQVHPGFAWIKGYSYENTAEHELHIDTANGVNPRIDRVILQWSAVDRDIRLKVLTGKASSLPSAPTITRSSDVYDLCLAEIHVGKGAVAIKDSDISDTRGISALCGAVNSLIDAVYE